MKAHSPARITMVDMDDNRLQVATRFGATTVINNKDGKAVDQIMQMTGGRGVDTAIEAVGVPASFITCEEIVAPGGIIANIGVHGVKADLHLEKLWARNIAITTRLVDTVTTPMLLKNSAIASDRSQAARYPSLQTRQDLGCLRDLRRRRENQRAQGSDRDLTPSVRHALARDRERAQFNGLVRKGRGAVANERWCIW